MIGADDPCIPMPVDRASGMLPRHPLDGSKPRHSIRGGRSTIRGGMTA